MPAETLAFINHSLVSLGFPALKADLDKLSNVGDVENTLLSIVNGLQSKIQYCSDLEARMSRIHSDYESLLNANEKLKQKCENIANSEFNARVKSEQLESNLVQTLKENQILKDELKSNKTSLAYCKNQQIVDIPLGPMYTFILFKHDIRKKEREVEKMKNTLQKYTTDGLKSAKIAMKIVNPSSTGIFSKKQAINDSEDLSEMNIYQESLRNADEREQLLINENLLLRQTCYDAYACVESLLSKTIQPSLKKHMVNSEQKPRFFMPFDSVSCQIDQVLRDSVDHLEQRVLEFEKSVSSSQKSEDEIKLYRHQIDECRNVIQEQQKLLEMSLSSGAMNNNNKEKNLANCRELVDAEVREERERLQEHKRQLDQERKQFTEAAIKLGRERAAFESEKDKFEEEKRILETQNVLKDLPTTPSWLRKSIQKINEGTPGGYSPFQAHVSRISHAPTSNATPSFMKQTVREVLKEEEEENVDDDLNIYLQPSQADIQNTPAPPKPIIRKKQNPKIQDENKIQNCD